VLKENAFHLHYLLEVDSATINLPWMIGRNSLIHFVYLIELK